MGASVVVDVLNTFLNMLSLSSGTCPDMKLTSSTAKINFSDILYQNDDLTLTGLVKIYINNYISNYINNSIIICLVTNNDNGLTLTTQYV
jgi:hypothetical protein